MCDVVTLSSDDDEPQIVAGPQVQPSVHVSIVNARPLDPFALGLNAGNTLTNLSGCIDAEQLRKALTTVAGRRSKMRQPISYRNKPSASVAPYRSYNTHLSLMQTYNLKKKQRQAALKQALKDQPPPPPKPMVPKIRYPSPPRTHPAGLEVDWRRRFNRASIPQAIVAPVDRFVSDSRLKSYHFSAVGQAEPADLEFRKRRFPHLRFKCSFGGCRRIVIGDYHFVLHLWAHIVAFREHTEETPCQPATHKKLGLALSKRNDVDKLARCSECLTRFHYPIQMQIHYTKVHSRVPQALKLSTCMICEKDVGGGSEGLRKHLLLHSPKDAPYNCRVCKFRTTLRNDLLDHYIEAHGNTGTLMCPFCMYTHVIPGNKLNRALFIMSAFVQHMKDHAEKRRVQCEMCACSFTDEHGVRQHRMDHMQIHDNWTITQGITPGLRSDMVDPREKCKECGVLPSNLMKKNEKCDNCMEIYFWEEIKLREDSLVGTDKENSHSVGGRIPAPRGSHFQCFCGMLTISTRDLMRHYEKTQHFFKIIQMDVMPKPERSILAERHMPEAEIDEACMFGLRFVEDPIQMNKDALERAVYHQRVTVENPFNVSDDPRFTNWKADSNLEARRFNKSVGEEVEIKQVYLKEALELAKALSALPHSDGEESESEEQEETETEDNEDGVLADSETEQDDEEQEQDDEEREQDDEEQTEDDQEDEDEQEEGEEDEQEVEEGMEVIDYENGDQENMHMMYEVDYVQDGMSTGESEVDEDEEEEMDMDQAENIFPLGLLTPETETDSDGTL